MLEHLRILSYSFDIIKKYQSCENAKGAENQQGSRH